MPEYPEILRAVQLMRQQIRWQADSAQRHLQKRILRGHLPESATISDYEQIIQFVLQDASANVYRYWYNRLAYVAITANVQDRQWLVIFTPNGVMESAFVVERPERYLSKPGFEWIGLLGEVDHEL